MRERQDLIGKREDPARLLYGELCWMRGEGGFRRQAGPDRVQRVRGRFSGQVLCTVLNLRVLLTARGLRRNGVTVQIGAAEALAWVRIGDILMFQTEACRTVPMKEFRCRKEARVLRVKREIQYGSHKLKLSEPQGHTEQGEQIGQNFIKALAERNRG